MNVKTRGEKIDEFIEAIISTVRTAVEIAVIIGGIAAICLIINMNRQITDLENTIDQMEEQYQNREEDERLIIRDAVTGRVIYDQPR